MLRSLQEMRGYSVATRNRQLGHVHDFYFDGSLWKIWYLVVNGGRRLSHRNVVLDPHAIDSADWSRRELSVSVTKEQVKEAIGAPPPRPGSMPPDMADVAEEAGGENASVLRSAKATVQYTVLASDGKVGEVADLIVDDEDWVIRYLVVDIFAVLPGARVVLPPTWAIDTVWADRAFKLDIELKKVRDAPHYDPTEPVDRAYEEKVFDYYGRPVYWYDVTMPMG